MDFISFLNKNFLILSFTSDIITEAVELSKKNSNYDFEDTLQAVCAKQNNIFTIITNDKKFPKIDGIKIYSPKILQ